MTGQAVPFSQYMREALYGEDGYYMVARERFGKTGDFYTSAQVSPIFGELWAHFIKRAAASQPLAIVEMGVGDGDFAASMLAELAHVADVPVHYAGIELSSIGQKRASDKLRAVLESAPKGAISARVYGTLNELLIDQPDTFFGGMVFANEWLDAIPCEVLRLTSGGQAERLWVQAKTGDGAAAADATSAYSPGPFQGGRYGSEWRPVEDAQLLEYARKWIQPLFREFQHDPVKRLVAEVPIQGLQALTQVVERLAPSRLALVDYGGYTLDVVGPDRPHGSLRAYRRHRLVGDFLDQKGLVDLTCDVDFSPVMAHIAQMGYRVELKKQGVFLLTLPFFEQVASSRAKWDAHVHQDIKTLVLPGGMGERFFVLLAERG